MSERGWSEELVGVRRMRRSAGLEVEVARGGLSFVQGVDCYTQGSFSVIRRGGNVPERNFQYTVIMTIIDVVVPYGPDSPLLQ